VIASNTLVEEGLNTPTIASEDWGTGYRVQGWQDFNGRQTSADKTSEMLEGVPSGNGIRYHLSKLEDMSQLESQLNRALQAKLPS
jgi:hypothetical protein